MWCMHTPASIPHPSAQVLKNVYYDYYQLIMFSLVAITLQQGIYVMKVYMYPGYITTDSYTGLL